MKKAQAPLGFAEGLVLGESLNSLAHRYGIRWDTARRFSQSPEVVAQVAELNRAAKEHLRRKVLSAGEEAVDRVLELMRQDKDRGVALQAARLLLAPLGMDAVEKEDLQVGEVAALPDDELQALVERKRAALLGHPVPATVGPIDVEAGGDEG